MASGASKERSHGGARAATMAVQIILRRAWVAESQNEGAVGSARETSESVRSHLAADFRKLGLGALASRALDQVLES